MTTQRQLRKEEKDLISALLKTRPDTLHYLEELEDLLVVEMADGGMGSLLLIPSQLAPGYRSFGRQVLSGEFKDSDGVVVSIAINLDKDNLLYELDIWKVDFSKLLKWPSPNAVRITG